MDLSSFLCSIYIPLLSLSFFCCIFLFSFCLVIQYLGVRHSSLSDVLFLFITSKGPPHLHCSFLFYNSLMYLDPSSNLKSIYLVDLCSYQVNFSFVSLFLDESHSNFFSPVPVIKLNGFMSRGKRTNFETELYFCFQKFSWKFLKLHKMQEDPVLNTCKKDFGTTGQSFSQRWNFSLCHFIVEKAVLQNLQKLFVSLSILFMWMHFWPHHKATSFYICFVGNHRDHS